jgi:hypothetical protein
MAVFFIAFYARLRKNWVKFTTIAIGSDQNNNIMHE